MSIFDAIKGVASDAWDMLGGRSKHDARRGIALSPEQEEINRLALQRARGEGPTAADALFAQRSAAAQRAVAARVASARGASAPLVQREALRQQAEMQGEAAAAAAALRAQEQQAYTGLASGALGEQQRVRLGAEQTNAQTQAANAANTQRGAAAFLSAMGAALASDVREKKDIRPVKDYRRLATEAAIAASDVARAPSREHVPRWLADVARREGWDQPVSDPDTEDYGSPMDAPGWQSRGIETLMRSVAAKDGGLGDAANAWDWRYRARARRAMGLPDERRTGPMAQELTRSPIARAAVRRDPATGRLALDRDRALQLALGAAAAAHRRLDEQEER